MQQTELVEVTVVMGQFNKALAVGPVLGTGNRLGAVVSHEVEVEFGVRVFHLVDHAHAKVLVELDGPLRLYTRSCQLERRVAVDKVEPLTSLTRSIVWLNL